MASKQWSSRESVGSLRQASAIAEPNPTSTGTLTLLAQGILDSTGVLEVVAFLEKDLGLTVQDEDLVPEHFGTIDRLVAFADSKQPNSAIPDERHGATMIRDSMTDRFLVDHALRRHAYRRPAQIVLVEGKSNLTHAELEALVDR